jgi:hypothetical protein
MKKKTWFIAIFVLAATAGGTSAQPVTVIGAGDPSVDIPAVQAAVDQGGQVTLTGRFSFNAPPTTPAGKTYSRIVTISKDVMISGTPDMQGAMAEIDGGNWPFHVDAPGARVTIRGLHFTHSMGGAIWIYAAGGLAITGCSFESVVATVEFGVEGGQANPVASAIFIGTDPHPVSAANPGMPGNFSGTFLISNNYMDIGASATTQTLGITMFAVGKSPDSEVDFYISGNTIMNVSEPAINFRYVGGRAHAERNTITTGSQGAAGDAIRVVGSGSYVIADNTIDCGWADGASTAISVTGQAPPLSPEAGAIVINNHLTMSAPASTTFISGSAGIRIRGVAQFNSVVGNKIRGSAGAALAVLDQNGNIPGINMFIGNDLQGFQSSLADIVIDVGVTGTIIVGRQSGVEDSGSGTTVVPMQ